MTGRGWRYGSRAGSPSASARPAMPASARRWDKNDDALAARIVAAVDHFATGRIAADQDRVDPRILALAGPDDDPALSETFEHARREFVDLALEVGSACDQVRG